MRNWINLVVIMGLTLAATTLPATSCPVPTAQPNPASEQSEQHSEPLSIQAAPPLDVWNGSAATSATCLLEHLPAILMLGPDSNAPAWPTRTTPLEIAELDVPSMIGWRIICQAQAPPL